LPLLAISASVTAFGREMIEQTKRLVLEKYTKENGYEFDSDVIYGDTDSVMVNFGTADIAESMRLGKEAADHVSKHFIAPIKLEFEKCYYPYLLMNKKRYAGLLWTNPNSYDKMDCKGIETVRRDNCGLVKEVVQGALDELLINKDSDAAINRVKGVVSDLLQARVDLSLLVITKGLNKRVDEENKNGYANKSA
jgi:DNA polymerase delta subunit 1